MAKKLKVLDLSQKQVKADPQLLTMRLKEINSQMAQLKKLDTEIKGQLTKEYFTKTVFDNEGNEVLVPNVPVDNRGSSFYETIDNTGKALILKREARTSIKLNEERAFNLADKKRLDFTKTVVVIDEDAIAQAYENGDITHEEFESICDKSTSYAYKFVKAIEQEDDEQ